MRYRLCDTAQDVAGICVELELTVEPFADEVPYALSLHAGGLQVAQVERGALTPAELFALGHALLDAAADGFGHFVPADEVFGLDLHARLVVLSACQTALASGTQADVPPGDDWLGLVEAFHFAGASTVLATLWPVEDRATADLMASFYAALKAGRTEGEALAEAQRVTLRKNRTAHPFYWAGFTLSGGDQ
jgi:CHAT domain-containing protein